MINPARQHLYLMQNEFGLIKIGRSVDPDTRLYHLRRSERCNIELVAVFANYGADEETIHLGLSEFRLFGEWFAGDHEARGAIEAEINCTTPIEWPFAYDDAGAAKWFDQMQVLRNANYIRRDLYRSITTIRHATEANRAIDRIIDSALNLATTGDRFGNQRPTPAYTASIEDALLVWPEDIRPAFWEGSPIECCIAALEAVKGRLPKVPHE